MRDIKFKYIIKIRGDYNKFQDRICVLYITLNEIKWERDWQDLIYEKIIRTYPDMNIYTSYDFIMLAELEWTGLVDKTNNDVYEGDILNINNQLFVVYYDEEIASFELIQGDNNTTGYVIGDKDKKVVGDKFNNPTMINGDYKNDKKK